MNQTFTFYFSTLKDIYLYQCKCKLCVCIWNCLCVGRNQKGASGDLLCHSLPIPLSQNLSLNLGLIFSQLGLKTLSSSKPCFPVCLVVLVSCPNYCVISSCHFFILPSLPPNHHHCLFKIVLRLGLAIEPMLATVKSQVSLGLKAIFLL